VRFTQQAARPLHRRPGCFVFAPIGEPLDALRRNVDEAGSAVAGIVYRELNKGFRTSVRHAAVSLLFLKAGVS
jgi:hypothetical protein